MRIISTSYTNEICPACSKLNSPTDEYCGHCGNPTNIVTMCPKCHVARKEEPPEIYFTSNPYIKFPLQSTTFIGSGQATLHPHLQSTVNFLRFCTGCGHDFAD